VFGWPAYTRRESAKTGGDRGHRQVPGSSGEDRRLHERLRARELAALGEVYDLYGSVVYGVALKVAGDRSAAEVLTCAVFLDLWHHSERFDPARSQLRPWLAMLAHRRAAESIRLRASTPPPRQQLMADLDRVIDMDEILQSTLRTEEVRAALAALPEDERTAIRLAYFAGRTYRQLAADLDVPEDTIKVRMRAGLRQVAASAHAEAAEEGS
jgi:RNA polymerase sigma factor (sigma-70 family)